MSVYKRGNVFWYDFSWNGERYRGTTKEKLPHRARLVESTLLGQLRESKELPGARRPKTLGDYLPQFIFQVQQSTLERPTKQYYAAGCRLLRDSSLSGYQLSAINRRLLDTVQFPGSPSNANCALRTLRKALFAASEDGLISAAPRVRLRKERGREAVITADQEQKLMAFASQPLRDVLAIIIDTGMRPSEVFRLKWDHADFAAGTIFIPYGKTSASRRWVSMTQRVKTIVSSRANETPWIFPSNSRSGHLLSVQSAFETARRKAGLSADIVLYSARHTLGTDLMTKTGNVAYVMKVMGHSDVRTTMRYQHPSTADAGRILDERNEERMQRAHSRHSGVTLH